MTKNDPRVCVQIFSTYLLEVYIDNIYIITIITMYMYMDVYVYIYGGFLK